MACHSSCPLAFGLLFFLSSCFWPGIFPALLILACHSSCSLGFSLTFFSVAFGLKLFLSFCFFFWSDILPVFLVQPHIYPASFFWSHVHFLHFLPHIVYSCISVPCSLFLHFSPHSLFLHFIPHSSTFLAFRPTFFFSCISSHVLAFCPTFFLHFLHSFLHFCPIFLTSFLAFHPTSFLPCSLPVSCILPHLLPVFLQFWLYIFTVCLHLASHFYCPLVFGFTFLLSACIWLHILLSLY